MFKGKTKGKAPVSFFFLYLQKSVSKKNKKHSKQQKNKRKTGAITNICLNIKKERRFERTTRKHYDEAKKERYSELTKTTCEQQKKEQKIKKKNGIEIPNRNKIERSRCRRSRRLCGELM